MAPRTIQFASRPIDGQADDWMMVRRFVDLGSQDAFSQLVTRHINWVYAMCRKALRDPHLAEDAAQAVFIVLARRAGELTEQTRISGWLFNTTRFVIKDARKQEVRYRRRENLAREVEIERQQVKPGPSIDPKIQSHLDNALAMLSERDRHALIMHFYEGMPLAKIAEVLGIGKEGAKKRVARALARLRERLGRSGTGLSLIVLGLVLRARTAEAAPTNLVIETIAQSLSPVAGAGGAHAIAAQAMQAVISASRRLLRAALGFEVVVALTLLTIPLWPARQSARVAPSVAAVTPHNVTVAQANISNQLAIETPQAALDPAPRSDYRSGAFDPEPTIPAITPSRSTTVIHASSEGAGDGSPSVGSDGTSTGFSGGSTYAGLPPVPRTIVAPAIVLNAPAERALPRPAPLRISANRGKSSSPSARDEVQTTPRKAIETEEPVVANPRDAHPCPPLDKPPFGVVIADPAAPHPDLPPPKADDFIAIIDGLEPGEKPRFHKHEFKPGHRGRGLGRVAFAMGIKKRFGFKLLDDNGDFLPPPEGYGLAGLPPELLAELREQAEHCPSLLPYFERYFAPHAVAPLAENFPPLSLQQVPEPGGLCLLCLAAAMTSRRKRARIQNS